MMQPSLRTTFLVLLIFAAKVGPAGETPRRPEAILLIDDGAKVLTANRGTGTISVVDLESRRVVEEANVGRAPADLRATADPDVWLVVDSKAGELLLLERRNGSIGRTKSIAVPADPVHAVVFGDGRRALVLSRWSRAATIAAWDGPDGLRIETTIELPFSPREAFALPGDPTAWIIADAFGGRLALVDPSEATDAVRRVWTLPDHNLRGLSPTPDGRSLAILAQNATSTAQTTRADVEWGVLLRSWIRLLPIDALSSFETTDDELLGASRTVGLSSVGKGSADPTALVFGPNGEVVVALAGVDEVGSALAMDEPYERFSVGRAPTALVLSSDAKTAIVAEMLSDAITILDLDAGKQVATIPLSDDAPPGGRRRLSSLLEEGESLFRNAKLSEDGWMSCQTCHTDGHTANVLIDTQGDGSYGAPKRTPSLLGVADTPPFGWLGTALKLEDQIHSSVTTTMRGHEPTPRQVEALAVFLKTLAPPQPEPPLDVAAVERGREIFETSRCDVCHTPPTYTTPMTFDVGLADAVGNDSFNPPSLRGVGRRDSLLHDGSVRSLRNLFRNTQHPDGTVFTEAELADLIMFLKTL